MHTDVYKSKWLDMCVFWGCRDTYLPALSAEGLEVRTPVATSTLALRSWSLIPVSTEKNRDPRRNGSSLGKEIGKMMTSALYHCNYLPEHCHGLTLEKYQTDSNRRTGQHSSKLSRLSKSRKVWESAMQLGNVGAVLGGDQGQKKEIMNEQR